MKIITFLLVLSAFLYSCNSGVTTINSSSATVYVDSQTLPHPDKFITENDLNNDFTFSTSTNINVNPGDPKINNITATFYSDNNCQNKVGNTVNVDTSNNKHISYAANSVHHLRSWNIMYCGNFNGVPQSSLDADNACSDEFNVVNSISYKFFYNQNDTSGNQISSQYCMVGKLASLSQPDTPCTNADGGNCAYPNSGKFIDYITVPFGYAIWWHSCVFSSYDVDSSGQYWRLNAYCRNNGGFYYHSTLCYGDVSSLNGNCQSSYADPGYTSTCQVDASGGGKTVVNENGHLLCGT